MNEKALIRTTDVAMAALADNLPGEPLTEAIERLSAECDAIYLHIDADILDQSLVSIYNTGDSGAVSVRSGIQLLWHGLKSWQGYGTAELPLASSV